MTTPNKDCFNKEDFEPVMLVQWVLIRTKDWTIISSSVLEELAPPTYVHQVWYGILHICMNIEIEGEQFIQNDSKV